MGKKQSPRLRHRLLEIAQERKGRRELNVQMLLNSAHRGCEKVPAEETENMMGEERGVALSDVLLAKDQLPPCLSYSIQELYTS